jgi:hypothetical protein
MFNLENGVFEYNLASRTFGVQDMYRDIDEECTDKVENQGRAAILVERAVKVLIDVKTAYKRGDS